MSISNPEGEVREDSRMIRVAKANIMLEMPDG